MPQGFSEQARAAPIFLFPREALGQFGASLPMRPVTYELRDLRKQLVDPFTRLAPACQHVVRPSRERTRPHAIADEIFRDMINRMIRADPKLQQQILPAAERLVVSAKLLNDVAAHQGRAVAANQALVDPATQRARREALGRTVAMNAAVGINVPHPCVDKGCIAISLRGFHLSLELRRVPEIVRVEARDIFSLS